MATMIVTIDGPAGAGKSSVAKILAQRLGFRFLDTGAMYRAVVLAAIRQGLPWDDPPRLAALARRITIQLCDYRVRLDDEDVTDEIRTAAITELVHYAADNPDVRSHLVQLQRREASSQGIVSEGRDQGTVVFPEAACKFFLTASPRERAQRRYQDLLARGEKIPLARVLEQQIQRDHRDCSRQVGPLVRAADAVEINTDGMTPEQVVDQLEAIVLRKVKGKR